MNIKKFLKIFALAVTGALSLAAQKGDDSLKKSVVKIFVVAKPADYYQPWQMGYQQQATGSGLIIQGNKILTNAHVVSDRVHLQVLKSGDTKKYTAKVKFVAHDCELAMLEVDDPKFFEGTQPVSWGDLPYQREKVAAYGFPAGGEELSITEGVVSRVEVQTYVHSQRNFLTIQTDAAINPGNSGGPVFKDGKCVGISFQSFSGGRVENTGYIIPALIIHRFLKDIADGSYGGAPMLGIFWQKMESDALKRYYQLKTDQEGIIITKVISGSSAEGSLQEGDVVTSMGNEKIAGNGTVVLRPGERVSFSQVLSRYSMGLSMPISLVRAGATKNVEVLFRPHADLVPRPEYDRRPSYYVYSGFIFMPLTFNFLKTAGWNDNFRSLYETGLPTPERKQVVFINQVLPHDINAGYHKISQASVTSINGKIIRELRDVPEAFKTPQGKYHVIEVDAFTGSEPATKIVIDASKSEAANKEILEAFAIPSDRSDDLKAGHVPEPTNGSGD